MKAGCDVRAPAAWRHHSSLNSVRVSMETVFYVNGQNFLDFLKFSREMKTCSYGFVNVGQIQSVLPRLSHGHYQKHSNSFIWQPMTVRLCYGLLRNERNIIFYPSNYLHLNGRNTLMGKVPINLCAARYYVRKWEWNRVQCTVHESAYPSASLSYSQHLRTYPFKTVDGKSISALYVW